MRWPLRVLGALALLSLPFVVAQLPPVRSALTAAIALMRGGTALGGVVYFAAYTVGCLFTAPIWIFNGMAGYAYGPVRGALMASPANALGMTVAFLVGRFVLSGPIGRWLAANPRWSAVHRAVEGDAFRIGFLLRISPLAPQNLLSYGFSLTPMRLRTFVAVTWLGLLPITFFQAYVGSLMHDVSELIDGKRPDVGPWSWVATAVALVLTVAALVVVTRLGQRALRRAGIATAVSGGDGGSPPIVTAVSGGDGGLPPSLQP